ncbi:hypothetical protein CLVI_02100 [Clostridium vincentii]|uniref:Uncharacterized protein n=1 Tax=Clostridium vincentii TaxID=52704 RepID=A0A2T0BK77_9CLOT|nr:hypothetical protein CLVI_02100 [Clostridium vincentii]
MNVAILFEYKEIKMTILLTIKDRKSKIRIRI